MDRFQRLLENHARLEIFFTAYATSSVNTPPANAKNFLVLWWDVVNDPPVKTPNRMLQPYPKSACSLATQPQPEHGAPGMGFKALADCRGARNRFPEMMDTQPELLAQHYAEAGLGEKSAVYWGKAGQRSVARSAMAEAAAQFQMGLDQLAPVLVQADGCALPFANHARIHAAVGRDRSSDYDRAARPQHAPRLTEHAAPPAHAAEDVNHQHGVEGRVREGQALAVGLGEAPHFATRGELVQHAERAVDAHIGIAGGDERPAEAAGAGAEVKQPRRRRRESA